MLTFTVRLFLVIAPFVSSAAISFAADPDSRDGGSGATLPMRLWAQRADIQFGTAVDVAAMRSDEAYRGMAGREFSMLTPENAMKMGSLRPTSKDFSWEAADTLVDFAESHAQRVHGHTLVWHTQLPKWITDRNWTREELSKILREHIAAVVGRYRGRIQLWDVVNEALTDHGTRRDNIWQKVIGDDYIEMSFRWAHEFDPEARLLYNDYGGEGLGKKSDAIHSLLRDLLDKQVPVHGVGFQMHMEAGKIPSRDHFRANLKRFQDMGLEIHITEADVRVPLPASAASLERQARDYADLLKTAMEFPNFRSWTTWGFTDRRSWVPGVFRGFGDALPWDKNDLPKPAYHAILDVLRKQQPPET